MSDKGEKKEIIKEDTTIDTLKVIAQVDRSPIEQDLQKALEDKEAKLQLKNEKYLELETQLKELQSKQEESSTKYNEIVSERDKLVEDWQKVAMEKFKEVKTEKFELYKKLGIDDEKLAELDKQIQTPQDLDEKEWMLTFITESLQKAADEREEAIKKSKEGTNTQITATKPPAGSTVELPTGPPVKAGEAQTAREGIDDLYSKEAEGDEEAKKNLAQLWRKMAPTLRNQRTSFGIIQCQICEAGVLQGEICPYCGWNPAIWKLKGAEIF